jgi:hypothetical protein
MLYMILSCELNAFHVKILCGYILFNLYLGTMFFSFGVNDPSVIMNV